MYIRWASPRLPMKKEKSGLRFILTHSLIVLNIPQRTEGIFASTKEHP